jgi:hypothetical protein
MRYLLTTLATLTLTLTLASAVRAQPHGGGHGFHSPVGGHGYHGPVGRTSPAQARLDQAGRRQGVRLDQAAGRQGE